MTVMGYALCVVQFPVGIMDTIISRSEGHRRWYPLLFPSNAAVNTIAAAGSLVVTALSLSQVVSYYFSCCCSARTRREAIGGSLANAWHGVRFAVINTKKVIFPFSGEFLEHMCW